MLIFRILTITLLAIASLPAASAEEGLLCHKVVIAGDSQWPPYTIVKSSLSKDGETKVELSGIGIDLAKRIFKELDVPVVEIAYDDLGHMMQGLRDGEIDLIVSTYDYAGILSDIHLLKPAYVIDPITVAVQSSESKKIKKWDNLMGMEGVKPMTFMPDERTGDYIAKNLQLQHKDYLSAALQSVKSGVNKYIIGSDYQLTYGIKAYKLSPDLIVMKNLAKGGDVYMAFAKNSACQQYAIYVQKRLQDYKNNGTVDKVLKKYIY